MQINITITGGECLFKWWWWWWWKKILLNQIRKLEHLWFHRLNRIENQREKKRLEKQTNKQQQHRSLSCKKKKECGRIKKNDWLIRFNANICRIVADPYQCYNIDVDDDDINDFFLFLSLSRWLMDVSFIGKYICSDIIRKVNTHYLWFRLFSFLLFYRKRC